MATKNKTRLILLDGNALLHRAWHAIPPLTAKDGRVVNAAYGFAVVLDKMLKGFKPDYMVVAWDLPGKTFRHEKFEAYKAQRKEKEPELYEQIPLIQEILSLYGIPSLSAKGFEADDVIGTLSMRAKDEAFETLIVTGDQDALQLVDDTTKVVYFLKGISETKTFDSAAVHEKFGFGPAQLIDYKALRGDPSDNVPGVKGIGEKGAKELIAQFGSVEGILSALKNGTLPAKAAKKFEGQEQLARDSVELVTVVRDVPMDFAFDQAKLGEPNMDRLLQLYRDLDFRTLIKRISPDAHGEAPPVDAMGTAGSQVRRDVGSQGKTRIVHGMENVREALATIGEETMAVLVVEQAADLFGSTLAAIAISDGACTAVVPSPNAELLALAKQKLDAATRVVSHDWKHVMHLTGWDADDRIVDLMIVSYLLSSGSRSHDLASVVSTMAIPESFATEKEFGSLGKITVLLPGVANDMLQEIESAGMATVLADIEFPLIPILFEMEKEGIGVDAKALDRFSKVLGRRLEKLSAHIRALAGEDFNVNSPSQLATILFEKLRLPTKGIKKTSSGFSTAASELEKLEDAHEIIPLIGEYREHAKLQSTYAESLPKLIGKDGRIHTTFNQTVTATGRLSSSDPNLQNIPIKTELGNEIRKSFVADKGNVLVSADYSQVELRLIAVIAKDKPFIDAFREGADIHVRTASEVWGVPEAQVTPEQRHAAKAINFGVMYGMGPRSLARSTGMKLEEAKEFIDRYFQIHHAVRDYLDATKAMAHTEGYVKTAFGRRRYLPEIQGNVPMLVAMAERMAINMPVQGTAADLMKLAMIAVDGWLTASKWPAKMLLQVHDELVIECDEKALDAVARGVKEMMEGVASFDVPLAVEVEVGKNWGEMNVWKFGNPNV
ncbi:DNA polymerase I [Candidatus Uhrbacteria bacterium RIFOXYB12_FULL_58_10]|uniref:DNA polymerase I n=1 Tax=Candidatus Uhrbacteria bacterium RIFOXYB2_FULL_57_15 TaxID=1802422 RepID=A0A1F7W5D0_9BACT|nr:MAG: DNA polymerase I [Candidatus Uhrbacteria bacterium RIFOXYB12_FULL_58_10]OGL97960.1 MAG: DNA polymerase I [Candidatus Uhrbacteria bacterium RIFOXYB2_FULL_57_15]OGM00643.1 MAG: DNA polymerase I [Candidatus Uhrbacteria bacterium RIFOXYC12_FULL_57_11]